MIDVGRDFERMRDYVVGRLSDDERRAFEDRLVRDPELVRELEQSLQMREGLQQLKTQGYFAPSAPSAPRSAGTRPRRHRMSAWLPALAAAAVASLALFLWVEPRRPAAAVLGAEAGSPVAVQFTFIAMRGGSLPNLTLPTKGAIDFQVLPAAHATVSAFRVTLLRAGTDAPVGTIGARTPDAHGYIHSYADSSRLAAGTYRLLVEPDTGTRAPRESFEFRLLGTAAPDR